MATALSHFYFFYGAKGGIGFLLIDRPICPHFVIIGAFLHIAENLLY